MPANRHMGLEGVEKRKRGEKVSLNLACLVLYKTGEKDKLLVVWWRSETMTTDRKRRKLIRDGGLATTGVGARGLPKLARTEEKSDNR